MRPRRGEAPENKYGRDIDRFRAAKLGVPPQRVFEALQIYLGSAYINDFNYLGGCSADTTQVFRVKFSTVAIGGPEIPPTSISASARTAMHSPSKPRLRHYSFWRFCRLYPLLPIRQTPAENGLSGRLLARRGKGRARTQRCHEAAVDAGVSVMVAQPECVLVMFPTTLPRFRGGASL